jgi:Ca2+-transporting ATPase
MVALLGAYIGLGALALFYFYGKYGGPEGLLTAQTMAFTGIILLEKINVFNFRSLRDPLRVNGYFSNPWIWLAWSMSVGLQVAAVYVPFLQDALHTTALGWRDWLIMVGLALPVFLLCELYKWIIWRREQKRPETAEPEGEGAA